MLHPPMLVMGGDYEEGLFDPSSMGRAFALYGDLPLYFGIFVHYWFDERDCPIEGNYIIALFKSPIMPHLLY